MVCKCVLRSTGRKRQRNVWAYRDYVPAVLRNVDNVDLKFQSMDNVKRQKLTANVAISVSIDRAMIEGRRTIKITKRSRQ